MRLCDNIKYVKGIGESRAKLFSRLGIFSVEDLLFHLPRALEDRSEVKLISDLIDGESVCVKGSVASGVKVYRARNRVSVTQTTISDGHSLMKLTWFNAPFIANTLKSGGEFVFFGRAIWRGNCFEMINPVSESVSESKKTGKILPIYPSVQGLGQTSIRNAVENVFAALDEVPRDIIPPKVLEENGLMPLFSALKGIHMPSSAQEFERACKRLAFEELFVLQMGIRILGDERKNYTATPIKNVKCIADFAEELPFELTGAQKRVINEIAFDLTRSVPMNRLVQGDVGSGKTVVAAAAMFAAANSGFQTVMMAPTEILAAQHFKSFTKLFQPFGFEPVLLTGGMTAAERRASLEKIKSGEAKIIVGTHALISDGVKYFNPALVITDEQHRFGVRQRTLLTEKGFGAHTLVMTATPIPRTLSLILYGDLDVSVINELPPGRKPIKTYALKEDMRKKAFEFAKDRLDEGRQAYIICPLVEESEALTAKAAVEYAEKLRKTILKKYSVEVLHGRLKPAERRAIMDDFADGKIDVLVSTTVVEVGVDVPNATVMIIENAERFGLSQLHQLRGRIGRGSLESYLLMFSDGGKIAEQRMKIMCDTCDGFKISEKDLELRGPGEFFGIRQHGLPELKIANLATDMDVLASARQAAEKLLSKDPRLEDTQNIALKEKIRSRFSEVGENGILN